MQRFDRRLPHFHVIGRPLFITFRLHGSLPPGRVFTKESMSSGETFVCMDRLLDQQRNGPMYLRMPEVAQVVSSRIHEGRNTDYVLHSWVIMPNHVHLLITPNVVVSKIMRSLKGATARQANQLLNRMGYPFWQDESYDHLVGSPEEFRKIGNYIVQNPVRAGLATSPEEFPWSSAFSSGARL